MTSDPSPLRRGLLATVLLTVLVALGLPGSASAHEFGPFAIDRYIGVLVSPDGLTVDYVVDLAETPTQADGDAIEADPAAWCDARFADVVFTLDGAPIALTQGAATAERRDGDGGLTTMRVVCSGTVPFASADAQQTLEIDDANFAGRVGWREIVVVGDQVAVSGDVSDESVTSRLTDFPNADENPRTQRVSFDFVASDDVGPAELDDTEPGDDDGGGDLFTDLISEAESGWAMVAAFGIAAFLGALHSLAPGHGKTVIGAYLVGTKGTKMQALVLAIAVALSHTLGVLILGIITYAAGAAFAPENVYPWLQGLSAVIVLGIGIWLVWTAWHEYQHRREHVAPDHEHHHLDPDHQHDLAHHHAEPASLGAAVAAAGVGGGAVRLAPDPSHHDHGHAHGTDHGRSHDHDHAHDHDGHAHDHDHAHDDDHSHDHGHAHDHDHDRSQGHDHSHDDDHSQGHDHDHSHDVDHSHGHGHDHAHDVDHSHDDGHDHPHDHDHSHDHDHDHDHGHDHDHDHDHSHDDHDHDHDHGDGSGWHRHGIFPHTHKYDLDAMDLSGKVSWKTLALLGLTGGLVPSTAAIIVLLGAIQLNRIAFGGLLILAFGLGMAIALVSVGLGMVVLRDRMLGAMDGNDVIRKARIAVVPIAAVAVFCIGIFLVVRAFVGIGDI